MTASGSPAAPRKATRSDFIPVVVISLERARERRERIRSDLDALGIPWSILPAIDGEHLGATEFERFRSAPMVFDNFRDWLAGEIGCYLTFCRMMQRIAEGDEPFVCVLEDDARIQPEFRELVSRSVLAERLPSFDILRLESKWHGRYLPLRSVGDVEIVAPYRMGPSACGQIVGRRAAQAICRGLKPRAEPFDVLVYMSRRFPTLRILDVARPVVIHPGDSTYIDAAGRRGLPRQLGVGQKARQRLYRAGCDLRTSLSFKLLWGLGAKDKCSLRAPAGIAR